jgi:hypothetical protein
MMKNKNLIIVFLLSFILSLNGFAQTEPPDPPDTHGESGDQPAGNAPIGGGIFILLGLGAAYGSKKLYDLREEEASWR